MDLKMKGHKSRHLPFHRLVLRNWKRYLPTHSGDVLICTLDKIYLRITMSLVLIYSGSRLIRPYVSIAAPRILASHEAAHM